MTLNLFTQNILSSQFKFKRVIQKKNSDGSNSFKLTTAAKTTNDGTIKIIYNLPDNENKIIVSGESGEYFFKPYRSSTDDINSPNRARFSSIVPGNKNSTIPTEVVHNKEDDTYSIRELDTGLFLTFEPQKYESQNFINKDCRKIKL